MEFGTEGLTVVYGDNGSGKSGYVRLLKEVCRARARAGRSCPMCSRPVQDLPKPLLSIPGGPSLWRVTRTALPSHPELGSVSVFDRACASVYVTAENEVAYRPFCWTRSMPWRRQLRQSRRN